MKIYKISAPIPFGEEGKEELFQNPEVFITEEEYQDINESIPSKVQQYFEEKYPHARPIGMGSFGIAYDIGNNKVVKITTDRAEIGFLKRGLNFPFVIDFYDIKFFGKIAIIEMEKVTLLENDQEASDAYELAESDIYDEERHKTPKKIKKERRKMSVMQQYQDDKIRKTEKYRKAYSFIKQLKKYNLDNDAHILNIGIRNNGDYVIFDLRNNID